MINITFRPEALELEIEGHANYAEKGKDIVCSAVSALFYTLYESLWLAESKLYDLPIMKDEDGKGYISSRPREEDKDAIMMIYWTVLVGLKALARQYPENISFNVKEETHG